jgi:RNA recognition motif-containing protein
MPNKLFVSNLSPRITEAVLSEIVTLAGFKVAYAAVIRHKQSGSPSGFGLVQLARGENTQRAIRNLNEVSLAGRALAVFELHGGESRILLKEGFPAQM